MAGGYEPGGDVPVAPGGAAVGHSNGASVGHTDGVPVATGGIAASDDPGGAFDPETIELIAQIRQLAVDDPHGVQQIVAEVLAALDRVTGTTLREP